MGNVHMQRANKRPINTTREPWMPLAARHTLMSRTQLLGPMSLSAGLHTLCATQSGQTGLVPRPDLSGWGHSRDRERPDYLRLPLQECYWEPGQLMAWWVSSRNDAEIKAWEEARSGGSDSWPGLQGALYPPVLRLSHQASWWPLSNFLLLLEGPLYRIPAVICLSPSFCRQSQPSRVRLRQGLNK